MLAQNDICVIANYFGHAPSYFQLWLDSVSFNPSIKWYLYTDFSLGKYEYPMNMEVISSSFLEFKQRFEETLNFPTRYVSLHEFCNFKPILGSVCADRISSVEYWAWTDCDMLYGNIHSVLGEAFKTGADKIMPMGHLSFIRNNKVLNQNILSHPLTREWLQKGSVKTGNFDEDDFVKKILVDLETKQSVGGAFANFYARYGHFNLIETSELCRTLRIMDNARNVTKVPCVFTWKDGELLGWFAMPDHSVKTVQLVYIHFFKREMTPRIERLVAGKCYLIVPNEIREFDGHELTWEEICRLDRFRIHWQYFIKRLNWKTIRSKLGI